MCVGLVCGVGVGVGIEIKALFLGGVCACGEEEN